MRLGKGNEYMSYFTYKGKQVYYEEHGVGPLLIFLHGNTASQLMFYNVTPYFKDYHVVLLDFLGHGKSDRVDEFAVDFWYDQGLQVIELLKQFPNGKAILIGSSGGALSALNVALEQPERISCVIADSFEGKHPILEVVQGIEEEREQSLQNPESVFFYQIMQGDDYEKIVNQDTQMMINHFREVRKFYHKPLETLAIPVLLLGSKQDEMYAFMKPSYEELIKENKYMKMHIVESGKHPAILSNPSESCEAIFAFIKEV